MILRFNNWLGGIADDQESPNPNAAALIQNFNIHERPPYLVSNNSFTNTFAGAVGSSLSQPILAIRKSPLTSSGNVFAMRQGGDIIMQTNGTGNFDTTTFAEGEGKTLSRSIAGFDVYNNNDTTTTCFLIWCNTDGTVRSIDLATPTVTTLRSASATTVEGPVFWFKKGGKVYVGNGNTLDSISGSTPTLAAAVLTLSKDDRIWSLSQHQNNLAIFTQAYATRKRFLHLWDTFSNGVNAVYEIPEDVNTSIGFAPVYSEGTLYFFTGSPLTAYIFDGITIRRLWRFPRYLKTASSTDSDEYVFNQSVDSFDGRIFFCLANPTAANAGKPWGLWSMGKRDAKYPSAVTHELLHGASATVDSGISTVREIGNSLYCGTYNGTDYKIEQFAKYDNANTKANGVLESEWIDPADLGVGEPGDQYQILRAGIMTRQLASSTSATVKIRYDYDTTAYGSITASVTHNTASDYFMATDVSGQLFRKFQYRVDSTASGANAPDIVEVFFDIKRNPTFGSV